MAGNRGCVVGLGRVGLPVARRLLAAGYEVSGYDPDSAASAALSEAGGLPAESLSAACRNADFVCVLVLNDAQAVNVFDSEGGLPELVPESCTIINMSTVSVGLVREIASTLEEREISFVDAPFTGGPEGVEAGAILMMVDGTPEAVDRASAILGQLGTIRHVGSRVGAGQLYKQCNQLMVCVTHVATLEMLKLAEAYDVNPGMVAEIVGTGVAGSTYFRKITESYLTKQTSPCTTGLLAKDIKLVLESAKAASTPSNVTVAAYDYFAAAVTAGASETESATLFEHQNS